MIYNLIYACTYLSTFWLPVQREYHIMPNNFQVSMQPTSLSPMMDKARASLSLSKGFQMVGRVHHTEQPPHTQRCQGPPDQQMAAMHVDMAGACPQTVWEIECLVNTGTLGKLYLLDAFANSDAAFYRNVLMPAGSSAVQELSSNPDTFPLQWHLICWLHCLVYCNCDDETEYFFSSTVWKQSALLNLLDRTCEGGFKTTSICPAMVWLHSWGNSISLPETQQSYISGYGKVPSGTWNGTEGFSAW